MTKKGCRKRNIYKNPGLNEQICFPAVHKYTAEQRFETNTKFNLLKKFFSQGLIFFFFYDPRGKDQSSPHKLNLDHTGLGSDDLKILHQ